MFCRLWAQYKIIDGLFEMCLSRWKAFVIVMLAGRDVTKYWRIKEGWILHACRQTVFEFRMSFNMKQTIRDFNFTWTATFNGSGIVCRGLWVRRHTYPFTMSSVQIFIHAVHVATRLSTRLSIRSLPTHAFIVMVSNQLIYPIVSLVKCSAFNLLLLISRSSIRVIEREREGEKVGER